MRSGHARGTWLIIVASLIGLAVSLYDFVTPSTGIDHSGGVEIVIVAQCLMLAGGLAAVFLANGVVAGILMFLMGLDIVCTFAAGYFLESDLLMVAMAVGAMGWIMRASARGQGQGL